MKTFTERILDAVDRRIKTVEAGPTNRYIPVVLPNGLVTLENELNLTIRPYALLDCAANSRKDIEIRHITWTMTPIEVAAVNAALLDNLSTYYWVEAGEA